MLLEEATQIAYQLKSKLLPYCDMLEIAGSIRRKRPEVHDIDIVLIPKPQSVLLFDGILATMGTLELNGPRLKRLRLPDNDITADIYIATPATWATLLLIRTGSMANNMGLCGRAISRGWRLRANGDGLFDQHGNRIAGDTEQSIYQALDLPYQNPEDR